MSDVLGDQRAAWLAAVQRVLGEQPLDEMLVSRTRDGLEIGPLYTSIDGPGGPPLPGTGSWVRGAVDPDRVRDGWDIRQRHQGDDLDALNEAVLEDLEGGVTSIELGPPTGGWSVGDLDRALGGVLLDVAPVALASHADIEAARALVGSWQRVGSLPERPGGLGLDPIGERARSGRDDRSGVEESAAVAAEVVATGLPVHAMVVDVSGYVDAGATEVQELAWGTATGVAYLRALVDAGVDAERAASALAFRWTVTGDQFLSLAKLRAARRLWARVLEASGLEVARRGQYQQAATPISLYSRRDPWVNLMRATTAALAAVVGGAQAVTVLPFDRALGQPDGLGRRTARNTQLLLLEESHLARVVDPAGGSWYVESLTDRLAREAWARFQAVERAGGMERHLASGALRQQVDASWEARLSAVSTRKEAITGVSEFPDVDESTLIRGPAVAGDEDGLPIRRPAAPFEALRDSVDRHRAETGSRPRVHVAALGSLARHGARSAWVANLLGAGGIASVGGDRDGPESPIAVEADFVASGTKVAVISAPDDLYRERGAATAMALKEAGATLLALAGDPGPQRAELQSAGVDEFWADGIDVLATLRRVHAALGLRPA